MAIATPPTTFEAEAATIIGSTPNDTAVWRRRFRSFFGTSSFICAALWQEVPQPSASRPRHLLWSLLMLKVYRSEHVHAALCHTDEKTYRKWTWFFIKCIAYLNLGNSTWGCFVSVDGTDCSIEEPYPRSTKWYSHKINGPGLRYEIGLSLLHSTIVW
eukprot:IDg22157t1